MNEFKRCMRVFSHSPFKVRLMLLSMLCDMVNNKPQQDKPSDKYRLRGTPLHSCFYAGTTRFGLKNPTFCRICNPLRKRFVRR